MFLKMKRVEMIVKRQEARGKNVQSMLLKVFLVLASCFYSLNSHAQCAMCRASLESSGNTAQAEAVNDGIVYLMIVPYVLVAIIGFVIYKMFQKKKEVQ
jgi:phosphatidylglycerophosphatase A